MNNNRFLNKAGVTVNNNRLEGYAVVFYDQTPVTEYRMQNNYIERVSPHCKITFEPNVICDDNHVPLRYLGGTKAKTLELKLDHKGLFYSCELPNTSTGNDTRALAERSDYIGSSFKFSPQFSKYKITRENGNIISTFVELHIERVSPVYSPAYEGAVRSERSNEEKELDESIKKFEETENLLKEADKFTI